MTTDPAPTTVPVSTTSGSTTPTTTPQKPIRAEAGTVGAIVALKRLQHAKSRMAVGPDEISTPLRRRLAQTMAFDTLAALSVAADQVVVVSDQPALQVITADEGIAVDIVAEPTSGGLNAAFEAGAQWLHDRCAPSLVVAVVADLPSVRSTTLGRVFAAGSAYERAFVADASGVGTTMLTTTTGRLDARFQGRSAAAHRLSGAHALTTDDTGGPIADARRDVDTPIDLYDAWGLGLGPRTAALLDAQTGRLLDHDSVTVTAAPEEVITSNGQRADFARRAWPTGMQNVQPGQRLHAVLVGRPGGRRQVVTSWL